MTTWKLNFFLRVLKIRMKLEEGKTADEILEDYTKLTEKDKTEIKDNL
ncbi:MAG: hypothetical protein ACOCQD_02620 [archaeon]